MPNDSHSKKWYPMQEPVKQEPVATDSAKKDAVFEASIQFIKTLTGMEPPPIEIAPTEVFAPFREFTEKVCKVFAAPPNVEQEPVAWMQDSIELYVKDRPDNWHTIPLYAAPVRTKDLTPYEITALIRDGAAGGGWQGFAQRVIAAVREKNK